MQFSHIRPKRTDSAAGRGSCDLWKARRKTRLDHPIQELSLDSMRGGPSASRLSSKIRFATAFALLVTSDGASGLNSERREINFLLLRYLHENCQTMFHVEQTLLLPETNVHTPTCAPNSLWAAEVSKHAQMLAAFTKLSRRGAAANVLLYPVPWSGYQPRHRQSTLLAVLPNTVETCAGTCL